MYLKTQQNEPWRKSKRYKFVQGTQRWKNRFAHLVLTLQTADPRNTPKKLTNFLEVIKLCAVQVDFAYFCASFVTGQSNLQNSRYYVPREKLKMRSQPKIRKKVLKYPSLETMPISVAQTLLTLLELTVMTSKSRIQKSLLPGLFFIPIIVECIKFNFVQATNQLKPFLSRSKPALFSTVNLIRSDFPN